MQCARQWANSQDSKFPHFIKWTFLNAPGIKHHRNAVKHIADQKMLTDSSMLYHWQISLHFLQTKKKLPHPQSNLWMQCATQWANSHDSEFTYIEFTILKGKKAKDPCFTSHYYNTYPVQKQASRPSRDQLANLMYSPQTPSHHRKGVDPLMHHFVSDYYTFGDLRGSALRKVASKATMQMNCTLSGLYPVIVINQVQIS